MWVNFDGHKASHKICKQIHHGKTWHSYVALCHISNIWPLDSNSLFTLKWMLQATKSPSGFGHHCHPMLAKGKLFSFQILPNLSSDMHQEVACALVLMGVGAGPL